MIPRVVASEMGKAQTGEASFTGVVGLHQLRSKKRKCLGRHAKESDSLVRVRLL